MASELVDVGWDFVCLSETHTLSETLMFAGSRKLFCTLDTNRAAGVAILARECHVSSVRRVHRVSDRVMAIDVVIFSKLTRLISVYFPHSNLAPQFLDECYAQVFALIEDVMAKHLAFVVGGDFNSTLDDGPRGLQLQELIDGFNLQVCNHPHRLAMHDAWTYEHTLHGRPY